MHTPRRILAISLGGSVPQRSRCWRASIGLGSLTPHLVLSPEGPQPCWCRKEESLTTSVGPAAAQEGTRRHSFPHPCVLGWLPWWDRHIWPHAPQMRCCGVTDYTDWYPVLGENTVPDRCCMENSQGCGRNSTTPLWRTVRLDISALGSLIPCALDVPGSRNDGN